MARRKRTSVKNDQPIGVGLTTKQMKRKKPLSQEYLVDIEPLTENQKELFDSYQKANILLLMVVQAQERPLSPSTTRFVMFWTRTRHMSVSTLYALWSPLERLDSCQDLMKIRQTFTRFHIRIW